MSQDNPISPQTPQTSEPQKIEPELKLGDLMDKDPLLLEDKEIDQIAEYFRVQYANWIAEEQRAMMDEKRPKVAKGTSEKKAKGVTLDDLGL